jgi:hypothetical protein
MMLSTGARRNPRGHHDHAGDRYWITSSAVANSDAVAAPPSPAMNSAVAFVSIPRTNQ